MSSTAIPAFYLYGEPHRAVEDGFLHVEQLDDRSRPSEWTIQPHEHADLAQLFVISIGGGTMLADGSALSFAAPAVLVVPAGVVHGFTWTDESAGVVITLAHSFLAQLVERHGALRPIFSRPRALRLDEEALSCLMADADGLQRELGWSATGHHAAIEAGLLSVLVRVVRQPDLEDDRTGLEPGPHAALVARYRERISVRFRLREPVADHAAALGASETRLRTACARVAGRSPAAMLDDRAMLEARRSLLYTNLSISEVAFAIGFADPAYFTRFFTRHAGVSPSMFRKQSKRESRGCIIAAAQKPEVAAR